MIIEKPIIGDGHELFTNFKRALDQSLEMYEENESGFERHALEAIRAISGEDASWEKVHDFRSRVIDYLHVTFASLFGTPCPAELEEAAIDALLSSLTVQS
jgi:hypothetical protein